MSEEATNERPTIALEEAQRRLRETGRLEGVTVYHTLPVVFDHAAREALGIPTCPGWEVRDCTFIYTGSTADFGFEFDAETKP